MDFYAPLTRIGPMQGRRRRGEGRFHRAPGGRDGSNDLAGRLRALEGAPYPAYRDLRGRYRIGAASLEIQHVQPDPFAPPTRIGLSVPLPETGLEWAAGDSLAGLAAEDLLARRVDAWLASHREVGSVVRIDPPVQQILRRSAITLHSDRLDILLTAALPARGRRIEGRRAASAIAEGLPRMLRETVARSAWDSSRLARHRESLEDHAALTTLLADRGWVAFIADGSHLARRSGEDDSPLEEGSVPFTAPPEFAAEVELPHAGRIRGTAIPRGITLLCGGGFHGKSTLLRALAVAVYAHIPGDGRERVAVEPTAMAVRAEDGRAIESVDLRPFLRALPGLHDLSAFSSGNASGSTSQAAAIVEALAAGCRCLLIDEDTSATNFLLRDPWMARLLREEQEPIVPLLARLQEIHDRFSVSTILVVGGSGEAFRVADHVLILDTYRPHDATARVAALREEMGPARPAPEISWSAHQRSLPIASLRGRDARIRSLGASRLLVGKSEIDLGASGALVHPSQGRTLASVLTDWLGTVNGSIQLPEAAEQAAERIRREGPMAYAPFPRGDLAEVRAQEVAMLLDRLRYQHPASSDVGDGTESGTEG